MADGPPPVDSEPGPSAAPPKPRAKAAAAKTAAALAVVTVVLYVWFGLQDIFYLDQGMTGGLTGGVLLNVLGSAVGGGVLLIAAGFTFARRIPGAWTLCGLCVFYAVANILISPLARGIPIGDQLTWLFGFDKANGIAAGLASIFSLFTALAAAIAAGSATRK